MERYFYELLATAQQLLGTNLQVRLVWYNPRSTPAGIPGDPAKDFASSGLGALRQGDGRCGDFSPESDRPYALCPAPGDAPASDLARGCCRHLAYAVPYSLFTALPWLAGRSTVVLSPRLAAFPEATWQGVVAHELGHTVDFWLFGSKYGLRDHAASCSDPRLVQRLQQVAAHEPDAELRADLLADAVLLQPAGRKLCYASATTLQVLVPDSQGSEGSGEGPCSGQRGLLEHFPHPPQMGG